MTKEKNVKRIGAVKELAIGNEVIIDDNLIIGDKIYHKVEGISLLCELQFFNQEELKYLYHHDGICYLLYNCTMQSTWNGVEIELRFKHDGTIMFQERNEVWYEEVFE